MASSDLRLVAGGLGLAFVDPGGAHEPVAAGLLEGVPITAGWVRSGDSVHEWAIGAIFPPLDLGLDLREEGNLVKKKLKDLFGRKEIELDDEVFDRTLRVLGDEPARVRALLTWPVRSALLELAEAAQDSYVSDTAVTAHHVLSYSSLHWARVLPAIRRAVHALRDASRNLPPSTALAPWVEPTRTYARSFGLSSTGTPLSASGSVGGLETGLFFRRVEGGRHLLEVGTIVDASMAFDLEIAPRVPKIPIPDALLPVPRPAMREVTLGDPGIDRRFVITTSRPLEALPDSLPGRTRLTMARLSAHFDVILRYGVLSLRRGLDTFSPAELPGVIDAAIEGARTLVPTLRQGYRDAAR